MFSKLYPAKIRSMTHAGKRTKDNEDEQIVTVVVLQYDFTEALAEAIGGAAPQVQTMLATGGDGVKVSRAGLMLDTKEVAVTFKGADKDEIKIERTLKLKAKARQANAEDMGPTLEAALVFTDDSEEQNAFLRSHLLQLVKVRMDRRQLELPTAEIPKEE